MDDTSRPVLVIGATGQQGSATARQLLQRGCSVRALVRDPGKPPARALREGGADLVLGDLDDLASLRAAMTGVRGVFLVLTAIIDGRVSPAGVVAEERRGKAIAEIVKEAGIGQFVYSSIAGADQHSGVPHLENKGRIEEHIRKLDVPATILRPVFFMDNFATHSRPVLADGELVLSLALRPETPLQMISTHDIGVVAAMAFEAPERFLGRTIGIAGDDLTGPEIADAFHRATGIPTRFRQLPIEQLRAFDADVAKMFDWFNHRDTETVDPAALRAEYPELMTVETWLRATDWKPSPPGS